MAISTSSPTSGTTKTRLGNTLTSRRGAWITAIVSLLIFAALAGAFANVEPTKRNDSAPLASESARATAEMDKFPGADQQSLLIVATRKDNATLAPADIASLATFGQPTVSTDKQSAVVNTQITVTNDHSQTAKTVKEFRKSVATKAPDDLKLQVTGGAAFGADIALAFENANFLLLAVTLGIVAVLLIATYRSPILWLLPLTVVALCDQLANKVATAAGNAMHLQFDAGVISVVVFGAGTNYALLLISRYREELATTQDHRAALSAAWQKTFGAIAASNVTVVLSLLCLAFGVIPGTHGLGIASAIGLVIAVFGVLFALTALLAICGRKVFWPRSPKVQTTAAQDNPTKANLWGRLANAATNRASLATGIGFVVLVAMASTLTATHLGLNQVERFRVKSESAAGLETLSKHFSPGEAQPIFVLANTPASQDVIAAAHNVAGVERIQPIGTNSDKTRTRIMVVASGAPGTNQALTTVKQLRASTHNVAGANAVVGGQSATDLDARNGNIRDLKHIAPLIILVAFVVLAITLRSLVAPVVLVAINLLSAAGAIGIGAAVSHAMFGRNALDLQVPLLAFMFLVALGIDYTIFITHRIRDYARTLPTTEAAVQAVAHTGGVITSAGIVLAAVFAALAVLPLITLGQLGVIVGLGVMLDALVVRTIIVPAAFSAIGDRIWWPSSRRKR